jgi:preprotein translocase subunit SecD
MINIPRWKVVLILATLFIGCLAAVPSFLAPKTLDTLPKWLPKNTFVLGLDLQGGSHLLLEVDSATVVRERMEALVDSVRAELRKERIQYERLGASADGVSFVVRNPAEADRAREVVRKLDSDMATTAGDGGRVILTLKPEALRARKSATIDQSIEIVRRRIDETGVREPSIQRQGEDRIVVQLPGLDDPERMKRLLGRTAKMTFHLLDERGSIEDALAGRVPPGAQLLPGAEADRPGGRPSHYLIQKRVMVSGDTLIDSQPTFDQRTGEPVVSFRFDSQGAKRFGDVTSKNVGKPFAIVLDGKVISAPVIREPILGGSGQISGGFTVQGAKDLALLLRAGALPAPLTILEERSVGPGLGADSIEAGSVAAVIGTALVMVFMIAGYGGIFGMVANIGLVLNLILILGAMSLLQATLTLPGIAGIVLTVGMAVDANVLIYERMREETRLGRPPVSAMDAGYARAMTTIVDSNLTTLIAAGVLYFLGSGPIRGFAVTLSLGILTSMFTAISVARLMTVGWLRLARPKLLPI